jgi:rod shape-determining protein MreD
VYLFIYRVLLGMNLEWNWLTPLFQAIGNSVIALILFPLLDRFQVRD